MSSPTSAAVRWIDSREEVVRAASRYGVLPRLALDVESDGMFAWKASVCTVQIKAGDEVAIVDARATSIGPLEALLGAGGPIKVVHDVAFDARILAEAGIAIGNVHDTSVAAQFLGRKATGLASLAQSELGVTMNKVLQHHDWRIRPLSAAQVEYLATDVIHLERLADGLWGEVRGLGIEAEVIEETGYRIGCAIAAARDETRPAAYAAVRGFEKLSKVEQAVLRRLWAARDEAARALDMPAARSIPGDALVSIARTRPADRAGLAKLRLPRLAETTAEALLEAVARGLEDADLPGEERAWLDRDRPARDEIARRRRRESALSAWRREEAKRRGVHEQVVLPGHCLRALAEAQGVDVRTVTDVPGFGACRAGYALAIAGVLRLAGGDAESGGR